MVIKTDLLSYVFTMHSDLLEQFVQSLGLMTSGLDFMFALAP